MTGERKMPAGVVVDTTQPSPGVVLVVDDDPSIRLTFRTTLESHGMLVEEAADGTGAEKWLARRSFDLVVLDLEMPGEGGMVVLDRLRERGDQTPVVVVSAYDQPRDVVRAIKLGAVDFLGKPLTPETLRRAVAAVIAHRTQRVDPPCQEKRLAPRTRPSVLASARRALGHRLFHRAGVLLKLAIQEEPHSPEPHYLLGVLREAEGKPWAAAEAYRKALSVDPNYEPAKVHLVKFAERR